MAPGGSTGHSRLDLPWQQDSPQTSAWSQVAAQAMNIHPRGVTPAVGIYTDASCSRTINPRSVLAAAEASASPWRRAAAQAPTSACATPCRASLHHSVQTPGLHFLSHPSPVCPILPVSLSTAHSHTIMAPTGGTSMSFFWPPRGQWTGIDLLHA